MLNKKSKNRKAKPLFVNYTCILPNKGRVIGSGLYNIPYPLATPEDYDKLKKCILDSQDDNPEKPSKVIIHNFRRLE